MDILSYASKVKTVTTSELFTYIAEIKVNSSGILANIDNIKANNLTPDFLERSSAWVVTRSIEKAVADKGFRGSTMLDNIQFGMNAISTSMEGVEKLIKGYKEKVWDGKVMTLRQANILNFLEYSTFWIEYSSKLINVVLSLVLDKTDNANAYLNAHNTKWLSGTSEFYKHFTVELLKGSRNLVSTLEKIPDVEITDTSIDVLESTAGKNSTDLLGKGFGIHHLTPVFWFGLAKKEVNLMRIDTMRKNNQTYAMKISQAINRRDGTNNPRIDREIEIYQDKIEKNEYAIEQIIKDYQ